MPSKIILDGYNVIHKIPYLARFLPKGLRDAREALVRFMAEWKRSRGGEVVIVFDRKSSVPVGAPSHVGEKAMGISCVFTAPGIEADDKIISLLKSERDPAQVTVVSADNKVINNAKALGVNVISPSFLEKAPAKRGKSSATAGVKSLSPDKENDITRWYLEQLVKTKA
jgi:predicted RNA-binding protein with PIN domain